jgi:hypothetical protein
MPGWTPAPNALRPKGLEARLARPVTSLSTLPAVDPKGASLPLGSIAHPERPLRGLRLNSAPGLLIRLAPNPLRLVRELACNNQMYSANTRTELTHTPTSRLQSGRSLAT